LWLTPEYPFRQQALALGPAATGFPMLMLQHGLDAFFTRLNRRDLEALVAGEAGDLHRLDRFTRGPGGDTFALARGPDLLVHIGAGNIPVAPLAGLVMGLLARAAQFCKCARGAAWLPRLLAHSLYEMEPKLGACLEIAEWPGGTVDLEEALFAEADCVIATGTDETVATIRARLPPRVRFLGYGHRVSFGYIARECLPDVAAARALAQRAARDVAAWDQLGCLSPHVFYVQAGGVPAEQFATLLAAELARLEEQVPRRPLTVEEAAHIQHRRQFFQVRAAAAAGTHLWCSEGSTAWTVVFEAEPRFQFSCLNRFVYVMSASGLDEVLRQAETIRGQVSTVGLAAARPHLVELAAQLARWGVTRVCPLGRMQEPPLTWHHDGRAALGDLLTWTDLEMPDDP
ncbi:MAG TPA: acyl-CoA reductase, partial [Methylomirabilota bacterium]|nr:acyl-CoA reductase [Methylomirabilota bacterium]